jgi:hypothetical protein
VNWSEVFEYYCGSLIWKVRLGSRQNVGDVAGSLHRSTGYLRIGYKGKQYLIHRVVWEMHCGAIPPGMQIDHINGDREDNAIENLRLVTPQQNKWNLKECKGWVYADGNYQARIKLNSKVIVLGHFDNPEDASACYWREKPKYHSMARPNPPTNQPVDSA